MKKFLSIATMASTVVMMAGVSLVPATAQAALKTDLTHCWNMDETSGTRVDMIGGANLTDHGTVGSSMGKFNNAAWFTSSAQYLSTPSRVIFPSSSQDTTFALWIYINGDTSGTIFEGDNLALYYGGGAVSLEVIYSYPASSVQVTGQLTGPAQNWYLIVGGFDKATLKPFLSVNNSPVAWAQYPTSPNTAAGGINFKVTSGGFLDEVGAWSRVLSAAEIAELYNGSTGMACPFAGSAPSGDVFDTVQDGKVKLNPGQNVIFRPPSVFNGGVEGAGDNTVTIEGSVQVDGSIKNIANLHLTENSILTITGGLEVKGSIIIDVGALLIVGGKLTCPGASVTNNGSTDIGNNQCGLLVAKGGGLGIGGILAVIGLSLITGLGFGVFMRAWRK